MKSKLVLPFLFFTFLCAIQNCTKAQVMACRTDTGAFYPMNGGCNSCNNLDDYRPHAADSEVVIRLNFHFLLAGNVKKGKYRVADTAHALGIVAEVNDVFDSLYKAHLRIYPRPDYVKRPKIKFVFKSFSKVTDSLAYYTAGQVFGPLLNPYMADPNAIDIIFKSDVIDYGQASGMPGKAIKFCAKNTNPADTVFNYLSYKFWLAHEIGHCLGLHHTFVTDHFDNCLDDIVLEDSTIWAQEFGGCDPAIDSILSNNIMNYRQCRHYLSPRQIERSHFQIRNSLLFETLTPASQHYVSYTHSVFDMEVDSSQTWSVERFMKGSVVVKSGTTLKIECKVNMLINAKIIVEKGAALIIDGGEVTAAPWCKGLWRGIEVEGTYGTGQLLNNLTGLAAGFGVVKVINGGTVSKANYGIGNYRSDDYGNFMYGNQGGIIICEDANFIDNLKDVQFIPYQSLYGNDRSKFTRCNFKVNNAVNSVYPLQARVSLWEVNGIAFNGCTFEYNAGNAYTPGSRGCGILSQNSKYTVDRSCANNACTTYVASAFKNFDKGVVADNSNPMQVVTVKNSAFTGNYYYGIYMNTVNTARIENNSIETAGNNNAVGLYMNNSKYYNVKNNTLLQDYAVTPNNVGAYFTNSTTGAHKFYRNTLSNFQVAVGAIHNNSGTNNNIDGLLMNCNNFTPQANKYDIALLGQEPTVMRTQGVTAPLGMNATNVVRNQYAATPCNNENKWHIGPPIPFAYQHGSNSDVVCRPNLPSTTCADGFVIVVNSGLLLDYTAHCLPNPETDGDGNGTGVTGINIALAHAKAITSTLVPSYLGSIDGGNTQALIDSMNTSMVSATRLKNLLLSSSPYLSDEVLLAYLRKSGILYANTETVVIANSPVSPAVKAIVDSLPLPFLVRSNINTAQTGVSVRSGLEQEYSLALFNLQAACAEKLNYFLMDTLVASQDSVIQMLQDNVGNMLDADVQLVYAYMAKGDSAAAQAAINALPSSKSDWASLLTNLQSVQYGPQRGAAILSNSLLTAAFEAQATTDGMDGQGAAQALLKFIANEDYYIPHLLPEELAPRAAALQEQPNVEEKITLQNGRLSIYPNPTQNSMNVLYESNEAAELKAEVMDLTGRVIFTTFIKSNVAQELPLGTCSAGVYLLTLSKNGQTVYNAKLIKQN